VPARGGSERSVEPSGCSRRSAQRQPWCDFSGESCSGGWAFLQLGAVGLTPVPARAMTGKGATPAGPKPSALGFQPAADLLLPAHRAAHGLLIPFTAGWPSQV